MRGFVIQMLGVFMVLMSAGVVLAEQKANCAGNQIQMNMCASQYLKGDEAALDDVYQKLLSDTPDDKHKALLEQSHKAWMAYRNAQCALLADQFRGGSLAPWIEIMCRANLTQVRIFELTSEDQWPATLGELVAVAGDTLTEDIFWNPASAQNGDFDLDGIYDDAFLGIQTGSLPDPTNKAVLAVLFGGSNNVAHVSIPIDGESGLCAPSIALRVEYPQGKPPFLVIDDGACDAFRLSLQKDQKTFELVRN